MTLCNDLILRLVGKLIVLIIDQIISTHIFMVCVILFQFVTF